MAAEPRPQWPVYVRGSSATASTGLPHRSEQLRFDDRGVQGLHHDAGGQWNRSIASALLRTSPKRRSSSPTSRSGSTSWTLIRIPITPEDCRLLVEEGATIITQKNNEEFLSRALNTPRTLLDDTLAKNPKKAGNSKRYWRKRSWYSGWDANGGDVPCLSRSSPPTD